VQIADLPSPSHCLDAADTKHIQEVVGILLYYAHAIDNTLLTVLSIIATQQAKGTQATMLEAIMQLLNYCITIPMKPFAIMPVTWSCGSTVMCCTSLPQRTVSCHWLPLSDLPANNSTNSTCHPTTQQWTNRHSVLNHTTCSCQCSRSRIWGTFPQCPTCLPTMDCFGGARPHAATYPHPC